MIQDALRERYPDLEIVINEKDDQIILSKVVVPDDKQGQGIGSDFMSDLCEYADDHQKTISLTPSTDFGASSKSRLVTFYKRFGFVENSGANKDHAISESMYREPAPELHVFHACPYSPTHLERLPKGSSCTDWKNVPARSDYWRDDTDSVTRCAKFSTGGDGGGDRDRSAPDDEPAPDGDGDGGGGGGGGDDVPGDVNGWERVSDDPLRWETQIEHPFRGTRTGHVEIVKETDTGGNVDGPVWGHKHEIPGFVVEGTTLSSQDREEAIDSAKRWMRDNSPDSLEIDLPKESNGWERHEITDEHAAWRAFAKPNTENPTWNQREVQLRHPEDNDQWQIRSYWINADGGQESSFDLPNLPTKSSMSPTGGSKTIRDFSRPQKPLSIIEEYFEDHPEQRIDHSDKPRLEIETSNKHFREITEPVKRFAPGSFRNNTAVEVDADGAVEFRGVDQNNVLMYHSTLILGNVESASIDRAGDTFGINGNDLAELIGEVNMSTDAALRTEYDDRQNVPPKLVYYADGAKMGSVFMRSDSSRTDPDLPDLESGATVTDIPGDLFKQRINALRKINEGSFVFVYTEGEVYMVTENDDGERARATLADDSSDITIHTPEERFFTGFSTDFFRKISLSPYRPASTDIRLDQTAPGQGVDKHEGVDGPIHVTYEQRGGIVKYTVAPRVSGQDDGGFIDWNLESTTCLKRIDAPENGPRATSDDLPGPAYASLRDAWEGYKIALSNGNEQDARQFSCIINGIRAAHGMRPLKFDKLEGFQCEPSMRQPTNDECPNTDLTLAEPIEPGEPAPDLDGIDLSGGDAVVWTFPNSDGCRCGTQALELDRLASARSVNVYGVAATPREELDQMADDLGLESINLVPDMNGEIAEEFGVETDEKGRLNRRLFFVRDGRVIDVADDMVVLDQPEGCPIKDHLVLGQADEEKLFEAIQHPGVYISTGKRGSGKSALAMRAAEGLYEREGVKPVTVGMPHGAREHFPDHWLHVDQIDNAPPNSVIVVDEAYSQFHAREAMSDSNKAVGQMVNTSRHCHQTYLFVAQNSAHLDKGAPSEADGLLMKEPGTFHMEFERPQFRDLSETAKAAFDQLPSDLDNRQYVYVYTDEHQGMIQNDMAEWYSDDISKSFRSACEL